MKKKQVAKSADGGDAGGYTVGQVSGSLFPQKQRPGSLSSLFSSSSNTDALVFVPAPKLEPKAASDPAEVKGQKQAQKQKTTPKTLSAAEKKLQDRESALQNADDEKPASSKKVKRKRADATDETAEQRPEKRKRTLKNMAEERVKMKRTVFVGNLPPSCTKKDLLSLFKQAGPVESLRFRSVVREDPTMSRKVAAIQRKVHPKKQNINAYIVFKEEEAAANALKWNGREIDSGFHIRVDRVSQNNRHDHKRSIFVGNLPYDIHELPIREHFQECGNIEAVRLVRDRDSGMGKGFGYILFESPDSVMLALKLDGSKLQERNVRVKRSVKKEKEKKTPSRGKQEQQRAGGRKQDFREKMGRKKFMKKQTNPSSFKGETADPAAKRGKGLKKKFKHKKKQNTVHM